MSTNRRTCCVSEEVVSQELRKAGGKKGSDIEVERLVYCCCLFQLGFQTMLQTQVSPFYHCKVNNSKASYPSHVTGDFLHLAAW